MSASEDSKIRMGRATVARGRTVSVPSGAKAPVGTTIEGKEVTAVACRDYGPGQEVTLPLDEIESLRKAGYLVDPDGVSHPVGPGPEFVRAAAA